MNEMGGDTVMKKGRKYMYDVLPIGTVMDEEYSKLKKSSFGVAKRIIIFAEIFIVTVINCFLSLILFLILFFGTSGIGYFWGGDFSKESFAIRGGLFIYTCVVFMILFSITGIWYALGFLRLQLQCKQLGTELEGASEVNRAAFESFMTDRNPSAAAGPIAVAHIDLKENGIPVPDHKTYARIDYLIAFAQIMVAVISFVMWLNFGK